jgi:hypothetical protein
VIPLSLTSPRMQLTGRRESCTWVGRDGQVLTFGMKDGKVPISDYFGEPDNPDVSADPPRVWIKGQTFPGCSYTRSLGDAVAKQMGILATPEVTNHRLTPQVRSCSCLAGSLQAGPGTLAAR